MNEVWGNRSVLYYEFGVYRKLRAIDEICADYAENGGQLMSCVRTMQKTAGI